MEAVCAALAFHLSIAKYTLNGQLYVFPGWQEDTTRLITLKPICTQSTSFKINWFRNCSLALADVIRFNVGLGNYTLNNSLLIILLINPPVILSGWLDNISWYICSGFPAACMLEVICTTHTHTRTHMVSHCASYIHTCTVYTGSEDKQLGPDCG